MTPREKVYRDALEGIGERTTNYKGIPCCVACGDWLERCTEDGKCSGAQARAALAAADAIPDAPVPEVLPCHKCIRKLPVSSRGGLYALCDECWDGVAAKPKPVPSRAELIDVMWRAYVCFTKDDSLMASMARVLDALIEAGAVR